MHHLKTVNQTFNTWNSDSKIIHNFAAIKIGLINNNTMKKISATILIALALVGMNGMGQTICDTAANIIIYSNYDGGVLNINVDQHIPNLKIGIVTYEPVTINISGTYVADVTNVVYAGYVTTTNHHCNNSPTTTTITGVAANITTINFLPAATYNNLNGDANIVCNYSCSDTTNQGGCNTPDQIVYYFESLWGSSFRYHFTQYGCWNTTPYLVSAGGNCCANPVITSVNKIENSYGITVNPNPSTDVFTISFSDKSINTCTINLFDLVGEKMLPTQTLNLKLETLNLSHLTQGIYFLEINFDGQKVVRKVVKI